MMEYCHLGNSGLQVSRIGLGAIPFGTTLDKKTSQRIVDMYYDAGGNLLDTANLYGGGLRGTNTDMAGTSERMVGKVVKGRRDRFVIETKGYWLMEDEVRPNSVGLSRTYLATQIEASLRRLNTDYIDLYQCHVWDFYTPVEETMRVLDDFVRAGKIRYIGVSNWDGWHVVKANTYARFEGLTPLVSNQIWYNLADRVAENAIIPACRDQSVSIIVWGALAQGFLTGRYRRGAKEPAPDSRFELMEDVESSSWKNLAVERNWATLDALDRIAKGHGKTIANVATRWLLQAGTCDVTLVGVSRLEQFSDLLETLSFQLSDEEVSELREVSEPPRPYPNNFLDLFCRRESEFYGGLRAKK
jgi:aryl-alcohol dehydrogenase-like predicted oxidoreductase